MKRGKGKGGERGDTTRPGKIIKSQNWLLQKKRQKNTSARHDNGKRGKRRGKELWKDSLQTSAKVRQRDKKLQCGSLR